MARPADRVAGPPSSIRQPISEDEDEGRAAGRTFKQALTMNRCMYILSDYRPASAVP